ncbi:histidine kinase [Cohnella sp. GbtcB17]|uniref:histidine kinase n=1 Tax=Cohnella sp. GbtcB17 TaxID=2824762 RepID=UPI001C30DC3F|nr:histidine kinase [Cohnella sp. GbtcB17]
MRIRRFIRSSSIFPKLVLTFIAVITPLFTLSLIFNELAKQEVKTQVSEVMKARIHYEMKGLEQEFERMSTTQQQMINDRDLLEISGQTNIMSDYQRTETINRIVEKLKIMKDSSGLIGEVGVYIPAIQRVISTRAVEQDAAAIKEKKEIAEAIYEGGYPLTIWKDRMFITLSFPHTSSFQTSPPLFVHQIEISIAGLSRRLGQISEEGGASLFVGRWKIDTDKDTPLADRIQAAWESPAEAGVASSRTVPIDGVTYMAFYEKSQQLDLALTTYIPENVLLGKFETYRMWFWLLIACSLIVILAFSYGLYLLIQRPLSQLVRQFRSVEDGHFHTTVKRERNDEFGYLFNRFDRTVKRLKQLIDELYVQKIRLQQSELKQLQAQISPHFLYNSFFTLHQLIKSYDNDKAELVARNLGEYFQYITRSGMDEVPLESEVNHVRAYMEIQNLRFSNRIEIQMDPLPDGFKQICVPRLILQPIIENAYHYGVGNAVSDGQLHVRFTSEAERIAIKVEDNGPGMDAASLQNIQTRLAGHGEGEYTGMLNVHRRLQLKFGPSAGIELFPTAPHGLTVVIHIPHRKEQDHA